MRVEKGWRLEAGPFTEGPEVIRWVLSNVFHEFDLYKVHDLNLCRQFNLVLHAENRKRSTQNKRNI